MTCIIGLVYDKGVLLAADSLSIAGGAMYPARTRKLYTYGSTIAGFAGDSADHYAYRRYRATWDDPGDPKEHAATAEHVWELNRRQTAVTDILHSPDLAVMLAKGRELYVGVSDGALWDTNADTIGDSRDVSLALLREHLDGMWEPPPLEWALQKVSAVLLTMSKTRLSVAQPFYCQTTEDPSAYQRLV